MVEPRCLQRICTHVSSLCFWDLNPRVRGSSSTPDLLLPVDFDHQSRESDTVLLVLRTLHEIVGRWLGRQNFKLKSIIVALREADAAAVPVGPRSAKYGVRVAPDPDPRVTISQGVPDSENTARVLHGRHLGGCGNNSTREDAHIQDKASNYGQHDGSMGSYMRNWGCDLVDGDWGCCGRDLSCGNV